MYDVVIKKFTFPISSPDEFFFFSWRLLFWLFTWSALRLQVLD